MAPRISKKKVKQIFEQAQKTAVLVVGDLMVDEFLYGKVDRISPEAPVPVLEFDSHIFMPGGAANAASNIKSLGGRVAFLGCKGEDLAGERLTKELEKKGIPTDGLITVEGRPTTLKTRVVAHTQQVVRIDREIRMPVDTDVEDKMIAYIKSTLPEVESVLISDYTKGTVTPRVVKQLVGLAKKAGKPVVADTKSSHIEDFQDITVLTPNVKEVEKLTGLTIEDECPLAEGARRLISKLRCEAILVTRAEEGMSLYQKTGAVIHVPAITTEVHDVTGAGDTVAASVALTLASGASLREAAELANLAAAVVIRKVGTATASPEEVTRIWDEWRW